MATTTGSDATTSTSRVLTIPNVLSGLRLATVPVFIWLFLSGREDAAVILYGVGATTDFFDGYIARHTGSVSELGKLLDPLADRVFIVALAVALVARGTMPWVLAVVIIARDALVLAVFPLLERRGVERLAVNFTGKSATAALLFGLTWLAVAETSLELSAARPIGLAFTILGAVLYWIATGMYAIEATRRFRALGPGAGGDKVPPP